MIIPVGEISERLFRRCGSDIYSLVDLNIRSKFGYGKCNPDFRTPDPTLLFP
jgi:hypothetical protein